MKRIYVALLFPAVLVFAASTARAQPSPRAYLKKTQARLHRLAKAKTSNTGLAAEVGKLLDYGLIAKRTFRKHWPTLTRAQRTSFTRVLKKLLQKRQIKRVRQWARSNTHYKVVYKKQRLSGASAEVVTEVQYVRKRRRNSAGVVYRLRRSRRRWRVYDIRTDGVSMEDTYRREFNRLVKKKGFTGLLQVLRKKAR